MRVAELRRPLPLVRAIAAAGGAAWRVQRSAHLPFDRLVEELRSGAPLTGALADPQLHLRVVSRLLPVLPPWHMGACMKRSLLLLHLWSRCGLAPCLHLGVARTGGGLQGHAWLTAETEGRTLWAGSSNGQQEAFTFALSASGTPAGAGPEGSAGDGGSFGAGLTGAPQDDNPLTGAPQDDKSAGGVAQSQPPAWDEVVCAASRPTSSPVCDEIALLGLDQQIYRGLNPTGPRVWELVRQPIKVSEILRTIVAESGMDEEAARRDVLDVLAQLRGAALIEVRGGGAR